MKTIKGITAILLAATLFSCTKEDLRKELNQNKPTILVVRPSDIIRNDPHIGKKLLPPDFVRNTP